MGDIGLLNLVKYAKLYSSCLKYSSLPYCVGEGVERHERGDVCKTESKLFPNLLSDTNWKQMLTVGMPLGFAMTIILFTEMWVFWGEVMALKLYWH